MKSMRLALALLLVTAYILLAVPLPVNAIADPDSPPQINAVYVYEDVLEDGDVGVLIDYYLDYAVLPTETATEAYLAVFIDTDNATQLKSVAPYTYNDNGYGRGLIWMRFTPAEVTTYSLDSADIALYHIWLVGNPTVPSGWAGDPPKTIATIDQWNTTSATTLIALRVLYYADVLELLWSLDLIQETSIGSRLTTLGESYFTNVISYLRNIAPSVFSSTSTDPDYTPISYDTAFGATASSGTATIVGSPVTLVEGSNVINTGATTGTIVLDLAGWTSGNVTDLTGTLTASPATINPGTNTLTVTGAGTFTVVVNVVDTITKLNTATVGTALDLTAVATAFGMSRWTFSGLIWLLVSIIICAAVYRAEKPQDAYGLNIAGTRIITLILTVCVLLGALLGLLHPLIYAVLFIGCGALIGYVFFFRSDALHKGFMFMVWMWVVVSLMGNIVAGNSMIVATRLSANLATGTVNSIGVASTSGFPSAGIIVIGDEKIGYPSKTSTAFTRTSLLGVTTNPILRGTQNTEDAAHLADSMVRTPEAGVLNAAIDYKIARLIDNAGFIDYISLPAKLLDLIATFFFLPLDFLGTDLAILTYIWVVVAVGMLVGFVIAVIGGRRV